MKIIVVGCGKVGQKLTEQLNIEKHDITVIDRRGSVVNEISGRLDVMGIVGNGANKEILENAGIKSADLLIAVSGSDELNILCCLLAKKIGGCQTIARIRNVEYSKEINLIKEELGLAMVINPELTAAQEISRLMMFPSAIQIDTFAKGKVELLKFRVNRGSVIDNMTIMDISSKLHCDVLVCVVERGNDVYIPNGNFTINEKDVISIVASPKNASIFFKKLGVMNNRVKDAMIIGGGEISCYLANSLIQMGVDVKIIEKDKEKCENICTLLEKATVICGDASDKQILLQAGLENTEAFISLTNLDEENILLSLYAKALTNCKIITKINRIAFDEVINGLDLDTTICPKNITAEYIVRFVRAMQNSYDSNIETMHEIIDGKVEALEFKIDKSNPKIGVPISEFKLKNNLLFACIYRNGEIIFPRGHDTLMAGDTIIVVTTITGMRDISDIFVK